MCFPSDYKMNSNQLKLDKFQYKLIWSTCINLTILHILAVYGLYYAIIMAKMATLAWFLFVGIFSAIGVLAGAHRLWCHRSYQAKLSLRILLMLMNTTANQHDIFEWSQDHRIHHKYSGTDADPYNANRGFWWSQILWVMFEKSPKYHEKRREMDFSDIENDPVIKFQMKYYWWLVFLTWGIIPTFVPWYFWSEPLWPVFTMNMFRYVLSLHQTGLVNSAAHLWGIKPYDKNIEPVENYPVTYLSLGEGYHNFHHAFPYDYSASEFGWLTSFNMTTAFIDFCEIIGLAHDKKKADYAVVKNRILRTGDNTVEVRKDYLFGYVIGFFALSYWIWVPLILRTILL